MMVDFLTLTAVSVVIGIVTAVAVGAVVLLLGGPASPAEAAEPQAIDKHSPAAL